MSELWNECKHEWEAQRVENNFGWVTEDVCIHCGSIGIVSEKPDESGFYQIVAKPWAKIYNLDEYRKRKEQQNVKETERITGK